MTAYVLVDVSITDPVGYQEYAKHVPAIVAQYGGEYIVRGGTLETLEGDWHPQRLVILKFESIARAKEWLTSPEYTPIKQMRFASATSHMIVVEGV